MMSDSTQAEPINEVLGLRQELTELLDGHRFEFAGGARCCCGRWPNHAERYFNDHLATVIMARFFSAE